MPLPTRFPMRLRAALPILCLAGCDPAPPPAVDVEFADACKLDNQGKHLRVNGTIGLQGSVSCDDKVCEFDLKGEGDERGHDLFVKVGEGPSSVLPFGSDLHMSTFNASDVTFNDADGNTFKLGDAVQVSATVKVERMENVATKKMQDYCDFTVTQLRKGGA